jgi:hypothetical protein
MATAKQIAANRRNALLSTGPRTPEGKRISSGNALTFGLFANNIRERLSDDEREAYDEFIELHSSSFLPKGPQEEWLAEKVAECMFLVDRALELNLHVLCEPATVEGSHRIAYATTDPLPNMALYHNRLRNNYKGYFDQLARVQSARKEAEQKDMDRVQLIAEAAGKTGTPFDPAQLGFVFSKKQVAQTFLEKKLGMAAVQVVGRLDVSEDATFAFQERLRQATNAASMA